MLESDSKAYTEAHAACYPAEYLAGVELFNAREFHAAHDAWEERWLGPAGSKEKLFLQALIQSAVAFYLIELGRPGAARRLYLAAKDKFSKLGVDKFMSLDLVLFQAKLDAALSWLLTGPDPKELVQPEIVLPTIHLLPEVMEFD